MANAVINLMASTREETLTPEEANLFNIWKRKAIKELASGLLIGSAPVMVWTATTKLHDKPQTARLLLFSVVPRLFLASVAITSYGFWRFKRSFASRVDPILAMNGSLIQRNLANIIVDKYKDDPWLMQRVSRRFYLENVYDDTTSDKPILRFRNRYQFEENVAQSAQGKHDNVSLVNSPKAQIRSNKVSPDIDGDVREDPLDISFLDRARKKCTNLLALP